MPGIHIRSDNKYVKMSPNAKFKASEKNNRASIFIMLRPLLLHQPMNVSQDILFRHKPHISSVRLYHNMSALYLKNNSLLKPTNMSRVWREKIAIKTNSSSSL
ncbi:hypothetical protein AMECASPLE_021072 [Ameca splendens]|uniref:Uncharacterized protein n=1 Tax=Ameca splendens TaxID=208324 RepID=A0ABV0XGG5_9TELE